MVHTVRRMRREAAAADLRAPGVDVRPGPVQLLEVRARHRTRPSAAARAASGLVGSTSTRIPRSVPEHADEPFR